MNGAYGTGSWAWYQRQHRQRNQERAHEAPRCTKCGRKDSEGLIDGLCNDCFCKKLDRINER